MFLTSARRARRSVVAGLSLALAASASTLALAPAAGAADRTPFVLIGTSDVSDSNLMSQVIEPRFEALYPQYDLQYVAKGTGAALTDARNGLAAAAIVHAAAIENQFVGDGFSLEQYGRLVFWGDYVLLGPNDDPAGIAGTAATDIVSAFEKVAAAGAAGRATFITRGGTPGTAVQEHALWALTSGVATCAVGAPAGGGTRPKDPTDASGTCTNPDDLDGSDGNGARRPSWYGSGNSTSQGTNVNLANTCSTASYPNGSCYVFTDRGTYKNLRAQGLAQNLKIVTRDNAATARGGRDALINVFHAYGVNPARFANPAGTKTDPVAARLFLDFMTATATQDAIGAFLAGDGDQAFIPAAAAVTTAKLGTKTVTLGRRTKITGNIANAVPGYPALGGVQLSLLRARTASALAVPRVAARTTTDAAGNYSFTEKLKPGTYRVGVPQIAKIEIATLVPPFGSLISAATTDLGTVAGFKVRKSSIQRLGGGRVKLVGKLKTASDGKGKVIVKAAGAGKPQQVGKVKVKDGRKRFVFTGRLGPGTRGLQLIFKDRGDTVATRSKVIRIPTRR